MAEGGSSFGDFMKAYETRRDSGAEGVTLLSGAQSQHQSSAFPFDMNASFAENSSRFFSATSSLGNSLSNSFQSLTGNPPPADGDIEKGAVESSSNSNTWGSFSRAERFKGFMFLLSISAFFFLLSSFFFVVVIISPAKFAFSYTLGSLFFMGAFVFMKGPADWLASSCTMQSLPFNVAYYGSILGTLHGCFFSRRYIVILFFSWMQVAAIVYYAANNIPGGRMGLRFMYTFVVQFVKRVFIPCVKFSSNCISKVFT